MDGGATECSCRTAPRHRIVVLFSVLAFIASLAATIAWKVSDIDFATKIGSSRLGGAYVCTALILLITSSLIVMRLQCCTPQSVFLTVQRYATATFGLLALCEMTFGLSQWAAMIFVFKVIGYAYSSLIISAYWLALNPLGTQSCVTASECTLYTLCTYLGMVAAGIMLKSNTVGAGQLGLTVACCSILCWFVGNIAFGNEPILFRRSPQHIQQGAHSPPIQTLYRAVMASRAVFTLVVGSILLSILVTSTEYYLLSDFEYRYLSLKDVPKGVQSIGSFVTLIGIGNILALCTSRLWSRFRIGRTGLLIAAILAMLMIRFGFAESHSLISSVLALLVVESLYPLVVESNLRYLLDQFPESEQISARTMVDAIAEPAGLAVSAIILCTSWFDIYTLGVGVVCMTFLLLLYSWSVDRVWRRAQVASFRQMITLVSARASAIVALLHSTAP